MPLVLTSLFLPGWQVDPGPDAMIPVVCPLDPDHAHVKMNWESTTYQEPGFPQRRILARAEVLEVNGFKEFLLHTRVVDAMKAAGLKGWEAVPVRIIRRDGSEWTDFHVLRVTHFFGIASPSSGLRPEWRCPGCDIVNFHEGYDIAKALRPVVLKDTDFSCMWPSLGTTILSAKARDVLKSFESDSLGVIKSDDLMQFPRAYDNAVDPWLGPAAAEEVARYRQAVPPQVIVKFSV